MAAIISNSAYSAMHNKFIHYSLCVCECKVILIILFLLFSLPWYVFVQSGQFNEDMIPTVGFNMRKVTKGNVTIKVYASRIRVRMYVIILLLIDVHNMCACVACMLCKKKAHCACGWLYAYGCHVCALHGINYSVVKINVVKSSEIRHPTVKCKQRL